MIRLGSRFGEHAFEDGTRRADHEQAGEEAHLRPEFVGLRGDQQRAGDRHHQGKHEASHAAGRHGAGVGDHEEEEDHDLRRGDDHAPEIDAADRRKRPARGHAMARCSEEADTDRQRDPIDTRHGPQVQPPGDERPAPDDDDVGGDHPDIERRPPEVERLHDGAAEQEERQHQPDVRRVEDVHASVADHVLRQQREPGNGREEVPASEAPVISGRRVHAQDERDPAPGQHGAGGPDEGSVLAEGQGHLDHGAGQDRGQDLRDADAEAQPKLAEQVDAEDHSGDMQAWIADRRQDQRVGRATKGQRPTGHVNSRCWAARSAARRGACKAALRRPAMEAV